MTLWVLEHFARRCNSRRGTWKPASVALSLVVGKTRRQARVELRELRGANPDETYRVRAYAPRKRQEP